MQSSPLNCPVDGRKINERQVRTVAFFILLITISYWLTAGWFLLVLLIADFGFRAFDLGKFSPLAWISKHLVRWLVFSPCPVDQAPKRFAAGLGLLFSSLILLFHLVGWTTTVLVSLLGICAALEAFAGLCVGCHVYTLLQILKAKFQRAV